MLQFLPRFAGRRGYCVPVHGKASVLYLSSEGCFMEGSLPWRDHCPLLLAGSQSTADVCSHHEKPVSEQVRATGWKGSGFSMPTDQPYLYDTDVVLCSVEETVAKENLKPHGSGLETSGLEIFPRV